MQLVPGLASVFKRKVYGFGKLSTEREEELHEWRA
jgi:hypothetical protein